MYVWVCMCVCVRENFGLLVYVYVRESLYSAFEKCVGCVYVFLYKILCVNLRSVIRVCVWVCESVLKCVCVCVCLCVGVWVCESE